MVWQPLPGSSVLTVDLEELTAAGSSTQGQRVLPGRYTVRITKNGVVQSMPLDVTLDRRATYTLADRKAQYVAAERTKALFVRMSKLAAKIATAREGAEKIADDKTAHLWNVLGTALPTPAWFPHFLRMLAARTLDADGEPADLPASEWHRCNAEVAVALATDLTPYGDIARHHLTHGPGKPVRPGGKVTCREAADALITASATPADLDRAYSLDPTHPLIRLALASSRKNPARTVFLRDYDLSRLPAGLPPELRARADALRKAVS